MVNGQRRCAIEQQWLANHVQESYQRIEGHELDQPWTRFELLHVVHDWRCIKEDLKTDFCQVLRILKHHVQRTSQHRKGPAQHEKQYHRRNQAKELLRPRETAVEVS